MLFESETTIRVYFYIAIEEGAEVGYKFYLGDTELALIHNGGNYYYVDVVGIDAKELSSSYTVVAKDAENNEVPTNVGRSRLYNKPLVKDRGFERF